jgi:hypothetical protein
MPVGFTEEHMRRIDLLFVAAAFFVLNSPAFAQSALEVSPMPEASEAAAEGPDGSGLPSEAAPENPSEDAPDLAWDQFDDPDFESSDESTVEPTDQAADDIASDAASDSMATNDDIDVEVDAAIDAAIEDESGDAEITLEEETTHEMSEGIVLGPQGIDDQGRAGRLHTVATGNTLWDLAAAYLGTPWVWPSVWIDNDDIDNPHLIMPGDRIWITANEMRVVTDAEAESYLQASEPEVAAMEMAIEDEMIGEDDFAPVAALETEPDDPSTLEAFPVAVLGQEPESMATGRQITISRRDAMGFVSAEEFSGSSSIVDSSSERTFLAEGDPVVIGTGEGDVEVGDQFTIFEVVEQVRDIETNRILGHHVDILGWLEVNELTGDTSLGQIRMSYSDMRRGVRIVARRPLDRHVTARMTPDAIEGQIVFLPSERTQMGDGGYVYLNRGEFHGVEIGTELEVYDAGKIVNEASRRVDVRTPDHSVAELIVVSVTPETAVAFVLNSSRELEVGDDVRPPVSRLATR